MIILKFIFFLFLIGLFFVGILLLTAWQQLRNAYKRFRQQDNGSGHINGDVVIDKRSTEKANRKIIPSDEGEYVDFTE